MTFETDGIDHINVYSKGRTGLGRWLSNFARTPFECEDGKFASIEAYWYWLSTDHPCKDDLRLLAGFHAKSVGQEFKKTHPITYPDFENKIRFALARKIISYPNMAQSLYNSTLPFAHYYVFDGKVIMAKEGLFCIEFFDKVRKIERYL